MGKAIDFSPPLYQLRDKSVHVEHGIGEEVHVHKQGITIGDFFETLDISFNKSCIIIPVEGSFCDEDLKFYVNNRENSEFENYKIKDLDRILISYGKGDIKSQLESVTSLAEEK